MIGLVIVAIAATLTCLASAWVTASHWGEPGWDDEPMDLNIVGFGITLVAACLAVACWIPPIFSWLG